MNVENVTSKLKNTKTSFNQTPVKFSYFLKNILPPVISSKANCCFATGTIPDQLKSAVVTIIFKKVAGKIYQFIDLLPIYPFYQNN